MGYKVVKVSFDADKKAHASYKSYYGTRTGSEKTYEYKFREELDLKEGDFCVVESPSHGLTVVRVVSLVEYQEYAGGLKEIVDKVDVATYEANKKRAAELQALSDLLERKAIEARKRLDWEQLFDGDTETQELLKKFKELTGK